MLIRLLKKSLKPLLSKPGIAKRLCKLLLRVDNTVEEVVNELVIYAEENVHPKHRLMNYHQFFIDHVSPEDRVLDVGCGYGSVAQDVAKKAKSVWGIDLNEKNIKLAKARYQKDNLTFIHGDALVDLPDKEFDVAILSNILEHIENRIPFLKSIMRLAPKLLIRVPMINRDWKVLYKKELGLDYRLDKTHYIEYTEEDLIEELTAAGLNVKIHKILFGEFWVLTEPLPVRVSKNEILEELNLRI